MPKGGLTTFGEWIELRRNARELLNLVTRGAKKLRHYYLGCFRAIRGADKQTRFRIGGSRIGCRRSLARSANGTNAEQAKAAAGAQALSSKGSHKAENCQSDARAYSLKQPRMVSEQPSANGGFLKLR